MRKHRKDEGRAAGGGKRRNGQLRATEVLLNATARAEEEALQPSEGGRVPEDCLVVEQA